MSDAPEGELFLFPVVAADRVVAVADVARG